VISRHFRAGCDCASAGEATAAPAAASEKPTAARRDITVLSVLDILGSPLIRFAPVSLRQPVGFSLISARD
jgi:hypothetical protein